MSAILTDFCDGEPVSLAFITLGMMGPLKRYWNGRPPLKFLDAELLNLEL